MAQAEPTAALELEGMVSSLTVLKLLSDDLTRVERALREKLERMPGLLRDGPLVLDLSALEGRDDDDDPPPLCALSLPALSRLLRELRLCPIGVRDLRSARGAQAEQLGWIALSGVRRRSVASSARAATAPAPGPSAPEPSLSEERASLLLHQPVRGGQVIYAEGRDAIVLSSVNSGGELIADGHIHVYGPLRGRALAGAHGDASARIFCQSLEAELLSIAGLYMRADELPEALHKRPAQIYLEGERLVIAELPGSSTSSHT